MLEGGEGGLADLKPRVTGFGFRTASRLSLLTSCLSLMAYGVGCCALYLFLGGVTMGAGLFGLAAIALSFVTNLQDKSPTYGIEGSVETHTYNLCVITTISRAMMRGVCPHGSAGLSASLWAAVH